MKIKFMYIALAYLSVNYGIANASDFEDEQREEKKTNNQVSFCQRTNKNVIEKQDLTEKEVIISDKDKENIALFKQYLVENLFLPTHSFHTLTPAFKSFKDSDDKPLEFFSCKHNYPIYSLIYYFANNKEPVEIKNTKKSYNDLTFTFLGCPDKEKESGKKMDFSFSGNEFPYIRLWAGFDSKDKATDTVVSYLKNVSLMPFSIQALYKFTMFKLEDNLYRLTIKLSSKDSPSAANYTDRKVMNLLVHIGRI